MLQLLQKLPSSLSLLKLRFLMFSSMPLPLRLKKEVMLKVLLPRLSIMKPSLLRSMLPSRLVPRMTKQRTQQSVMKCLLCPITTDLLPSRMSSLVLVVRDLTFMITVFLSPWISTL